MIRAGCTGEEGSLSAYLHVCTTCRQGHDLAPGETPRGAVLFETIAALAQDPDRIRPVTCLANCGRGCAAALTAPGKWSTLLGGLGPEHAPDLLAYLDTYAASPTGAVLPSRRAASLRAAVTGRIPG